MRILMLNYEYPPLGGGAGNATKYILREFSSVSGLHVDLVTSSTGAAKIERVADNITIHYLNIGKNGKMHEQSNMDLLAYSRKARIYCKELMRSYKYDLCHAFFGIPCGYIAKGLGLPYIVSLRGSDVPFYSTKYFWLDKVAFKRLSGKIWSSAEFVVANSKGLKDLALESFPNQDISVICNGIDVSEFYAKKSYATSKVLKIVSGTRLVERKGFMDLLASLVGVRDVELDLIGEGPEEDALKAYAKKWGLKVNFLGKVEHSKIGDIYRSADLYVSASLNEGMSNSVLEAISCSLPVVLTDVGGTDELVRKVDGGFNGFKVEAGDVEGLREKIIYFRDDRTDSSRMKDSLIEKHYQRKHGKDAYYGQS